MGVRPESAGQLPAGEVSGSARSPMRNRVTPWGDIVAIEQRGAWLGNRGILHAGTEVVRLHRSNLWITCRLRYRDWRLPQWQPGHYTVLYFFDEAVSLAAGHRPCALCRRGDYDAFRWAWSGRAGDPPLGGSRAGVAGLPRATELDRRLHQERIVRGSSRRRLHPMRWAALPAASFVALDGQPHLVLADSIARWTPRGYRDQRPRPRTGTAEVITPPSTVAALRGGYRPQIDTGALGGPAGGGPAGGGPAGGGPAGGGKTGIR